MYDELVKRLRSDSKALFSAGWVKTSDLAREAADAIEQLTAYVALYKDGGDTAMKVANDYKARIEELQAEADAYRKAMVDEHNTAALLMWKYRWIPVTERLPKERADVLAITADCDIYVCDFIPTVKQFWTIPGDDLHIDDITHWMPLPEPPKEESDGLL